VSPQKKPDWALFAWLTIWWCPPLGLFFFFLKAQQVDEEHPPPPGSPTAEQWFAAGVIGWELGEISKRN
jgi:hypothetical protein